MRTATLTLVIAALAFGSGCAKTDWIDRTLVTVDVTGTWTGKMGGVGPAARDVMLELDQKGSVVKGFSKVNPNAGMPPGSIDGTVAGDVFRFRDSRGSLQGELTVSGDEMDGRASFAGSNLTISLRRVDSSSGQVSPPR